MLTQMPIKDIENIVIPIPPIDERDHILSYINKVSTTLSTAISSSRDLVCLLTERRSALISSAVTGQIDVRDFVQEIEVAA